MTTAATELMRRELARRSLIDFIQYLFPAYQAGWVHCALADALERFLDDVVNQRSPRLIVFMQQSQGKSELVSRYLPAWALGKHPDLSMIAASYAAELISRMNRDVQRIIDNPTITGMGADILNIDDPVKDFQEAQSPTVRQSVWDWFTSTAYTRLSPGGGILLTMTRWHRDDLAGRLLQRMAEEDGEKWEVISFPGIATADEEHRKEGEALHPERWNLEYLTRTKATLGSYQWAALYQQTPVADGGNIFRSEWLKFYYPHELPVKFDQWAQSWDMAFKEGDDSDYVVGQVWARSKANVYLIDQVRGRMSFTGTAQAIIDLSRKWPATRLKLVEDKANGPAVMDALKDIVPGFRAVEPYGNKVARAHAVTPLWEAGNVFVPHPSSAPWVAAFVDELVGFPAAAHDDQVDAMTQALDEIHKRPGLNISSNTVAQFMDGLRR